jgi:hypothetical protein
MTAGTATLTYGNLLAGANNDCPDAAPPAGVVSLTIESTQTDGTGLLTLCIPRPDKLAAGLQLGTEVKVIDASGSNGGCTFVKDTTVAPTGTAKGTGVCKNGTAADGFSLALDGTISLTRTCGSTVDKVSATLSGSVAVAPQ